MPWFRAGNCDFLEAPFCVAVITSPAPNAGECLRRHDASRPDLIATLTRRAAYVLAVAEACGHRSLLLGAWGCGVFRNRPEDVAHAFMSLLESERFRASFQRVVFAVYDRVLGANVAAFRERVGG